jgi:PAS domain-containing protein
MTTVETYFAKPERADGSELYSEMKSVNQNSIARGLLQSVDGVLAVLNEERQIIAFNSAFERMIGIDDPYETFGLRLGEALQCVHADDGPHGCGTSQHCANCGATNAIVSSLETDEPVERHATLHVMKDGKPMDYGINVRSHPVKAEGRRLLVLTLHDVAIELGTAVERVCDC